MGKRYHQAAYDNARKDAEIARLTEHLDRIESGAYGLSDAVIEIKDLKTQLAMRETRLAELTFEVNKLQADVCFCHSNLPMFL